MQYNDNNQHFMTFHGCFINFAVMHEKYYGAAVGGETNFNYIRLS